MGEVVFLSLLSAFNPTLIAVTMVMLLQSHPQRLMLGYWMGAMLTSITLGLLIVFSLEGSRTISTTKQTLSRLGRPLGFTPAARSGWPLGPAAPDGRREAVIDARLRGTIGHVDVGELRPHSPTRVLARRIRARALLTRRGRHRRAGRIGDPTGPSSVTRPACERRAVPRRRDTKQFDFSGQLGYRVPRPVWG